MYIIDEEIKGGLDTWNGNDFAKTSDTIIEFMREYEELCRKHNITLSHEDGHGGFIFEKFDEGNIKWVCHGSDCSNE